MPHLIDRHIRQTRHRHIGGSKRIQRIRRRHGNTFHAARMRRLDP